MKINEVTTLRITEDIDVSTFPKMSWGGIKSLGSSFEYQDAHPEKELAKKKWYDPEKIVGQATGKRFMSADENFTTTFVNMAATGVLFRVLPPVFKKIGGRLFAFLPGAGVAVGAYFAGKSVKEGDYIGAALELGLGASGGSVVGAKLGIGIFVYMIYREIHRFGTQLDNEERGVEKGDKGYVEPTYPIQGTEAYQTLFGNIPNSDPQGSSLARTIAVFPLIWNATVEFIDGFMGEIQFTDETEKIKNATEISGMPEGQAELALEIFEETFGQAKD